ncbi:MAG: restriction endonuclease [Altererythrobacter sp.]|nr:restriction endonuclease [Altererythrobacter sp.]MBK63013.1 restriction endonuclease [Altererythrobacter sp.]
MMGDWLQLNLGDFIELKRGYDLPKKSRSSGPVPLISSSGVSDYVPEPKVAGPGVVTGRCGTIGEVFYIEEDFWPLNTTLYVKDFKGNDPRFVSYFLRGIDYFSYSDKAAVPGVNRNHLHQAPIQVPATVEEQRKIASVLSALDDKIELNRRMNETLEAQARALFRDWFVDFGPVKAKMAGDTPYLAPDLWSLFPNRLDDDGMPEGWHPATLDTFATCRNRKANPDEVDDGTAYIGLEHMPRRSIALSEWEGAEKVTSAKSRFRRREILFGKLRPYFHKVGIAPIDGICSTDIVVLAPKKQRLEALTLACVSTDEFVAFTDQSSTGTKMPRTSWKIMRTYPMVKPSDTIADAFQSICEPMIDRILANIEENQTLAQTRDLLLPKLMSDEIRVSEAERQIEEAR